MLASAIVELEAHPHETELLRTGTIFREIQCAASYGPNYPADLKQLAKAAIEDDSALESLKQAILDRNPGAAAQLGTTQAVDLISGGVKVNALPEQTHFVVNHRIAEHRCAVSSCFTRSTIISSFSPSLSSVLDLQTRTIKILVPVAERYNLTLTAFGKNVTAGTDTGGHIALSDAFGTGLNPSPMTPTGQSPPFSLLAGTIVSAFQSSPAYKNSSVVVQPSYALGEWSLPFPQLKF